MESEEQPDTVIVEDEENERAKNEVEGTELEEREDEEEEEEDERLRAAMKERMVAVTSMTKEMKAFVVASGVVIVTLAILSLLRNDHLGNYVTSQSFSEDGDKDASMTQILFILCVIFVCFGWSMIVTAATRAGWITRVATLGALALAFGTERTDATVINLSTTIEAGALCAVIVVLIIASWYPERRAHHDKDPLVISASDGWKLMRKLIFPLCFLIFLALYGLIWHASRSTGYADNFPESVEDQLENIQWLLIPIITLAGADFGDWGNFAAGRAIQRIRLSVLQGRDTLFMVVAFIFAGAITADGLRISYGDDGAGIYWELGLGAIVAVIAAYLLFMSKPRDKWPSNYPFLVLVGCVAIDTVSSWIISTRLNDDNDPAGFKADGWDALVWLCLAVIGVIAVTVFRRRIPTWLLTGAIFATLIGVVYVMTDLQSVTAVIHPFHWVTNDSAGDSGGDSNAPWLAYEGLKAVAGIITVAVIVVAVAMRRVRAWAQPIALLLSMTIAMQVLEWIDSLYGKAMSKSGSAAQAGNLALAAAIVLILALSWEFATSGESVTNGHRPRFPRDSRVMVFLGYIVVTATTSIFFSSIGEFDNGQWKLLESQFEAESYVRDGLLFLGGPLVITIFILAFNRWRQQKDEVESEFPSDEVEEIRPTLPA